MNRRLGTLQSTWTTVDGLPIHAKASIHPVPADRPTVVLVHGLGLSHRYLMPTAELLAPDYRVYAPDLPGHGKSGKPPRTLDVPGLADALARWITAAGIGRAALLGNSFGCQIIADCAARYPERVERAVLQGPTTPPEERSWFWQYVRWRQNNRYNPHSLMLPTLRDYWECGPRRILQTFQYGLEDHIEDKLPNVRAPTLVIRGARDPICHQHWVEELTRLLPDGRLVVIPGVAHTLVYTAPLELVRVTRPFLDGASRPRDESHSTDGREAHEEHVRPPIHREL